MANAGSATNRLYHNDGNGVLTRILAGQIGNDRSDADSPVWADYDNDGDLDLFVANYSPPRDFFYRNEETVSSRRSPRGFGQ